MKQLILAVSLLITTCNSSACETAFDLSICPLDFRTPVPDLRTGANSPKIYDSNGNFRGNLNNNRFDPDSISNPYGRYGYRFSPDTINNPYYIQR